MKKTMVLCTHNRPIHYETRQAIAELERHGAYFVDHAGAPSDVTLARNLGLSAVVRGLRAFAGRFELVVLVDDDMVFGIDDVVRLRDAAHETGFAASAMYMSQTGELCAVPLSNGRWATGLGLLAVPAALLERLALFSESFAYQGDTNWGFTESKCQGGRYWSEDFTLCKRLGGVLLLPLPIGHRKTVTIRPDAAIVERVRPLRGLLTPHGTEPTFVDDPETYIGNAQ